MQWHLSLRHAAGQHGAVPQPGCRNHLYARQAPLCTHYIISPKPKGGVGASPSCCLVQIRGGRKTCKVSEEIVGFHVLTTCDATLRSSAMLGPHTQRHKGAIAVYLIVSSLQ